MSHDDISFSDIHKLTDALDFSLVAVTPAKPSTHAPYIRDWLNADKHGQMHYLADNLDKRLDPTKLLPGAQSIICVADRYPATTTLPTTNKPTGKIARYAWGDDYHKTLKKRLHQLADQLKSNWPNHQYKTAVDTAPILEREHAQHAGLGWIGKHTLLINPKLGSWLLLGEIITTLKIAPAPDHQPTPDHCGTCTRCIDACPTDCITPYQLDPTRCISYLTIEHRGQIDPDLHEPIGDWIAGCDICQEVCPFNTHPPQPPQQQNTPPTTPPPHPNYTPRPPAPAIPLLEILNWSPHDRQQAFKKSALKRIKLDNLKRNALIAAGNHLPKQQHPALHNRIKELANDQDQPQLIRDTAKQTLARTGACD